MACRSDLPSLIVLFPVVLLKSGPSEGKIAVIVEIVDHRRVSPGSPYLIVSVTKLHLVS